MRELLKVLVALVLFPLFVLFGTGGGCLVGILLPMAVGAGEAFAPVALIAGCLGAGLGIWGALQVLRCLFPGQRH